ncbi:MULTISPECIES: phage integrase SAM-like domain-containing protein [unclassified Enterobacter cloacae complex]|uniref:phage integrase SAM-like domain-containing protein n=1 Tax=Enterobacter cloacae complex TaxID=354276 RepID=UPI0018727934|nr:MULTISPECIES: hypothetical protein [unclassified Enterobacter cloacae complex]MBE4887273.1 hypothetical protein [Enterobacter cloacae complex sp. P37RS]MBE7431532.1 hypothetical protein [Enterobacter cloacae complex sp. P36RS]MCE1476579.1 hypothetical protein [Enterobacter hormaechei]
MSTQIAHLMHTEKKGYFWRKRYDKSTFEIVLHTKVQEVATPGAAALTIRFMELEALAVPFQSMRETLKGYRDNLIKQEKLTRLQALVSIQASPLALQEAFNPAPVQELTLGQRIEQETLQRDLTVSSGHSLDEAKENYFNASTKWAVKTKKDYSACIDRFIIWANANSLTTIEVIKKEHVVSFKAYMDEINLTPNTKQKVLTRLGSMFKHCLDVMEWIDKNPFSGVLYKKVGVLEKKEEVTKAQQE